MAPLCHSSSLTCIWRRVHGEPRSVCPAATSLLGLHFWRPWWGWGREGVRGLACRLSKGLLLVGLNPQLLCCGGVALTANLPSCVFVWVHAGHAAAWQQALDFFLQIREAEPERGKITTKNRTATHEKNSLQLASGSCCDCCIK